MHEDPIKQHVRTGFLTVLYARANAALGDERKAAAETQEEVQQNKNWTSKEMAMFREGAAWQRMKTRNPYWDYQEMNPIVDDAINYAIERQSMKNPKDWAHVVRKLERTPLAAYPDATQEQYDEALTTVKMWAEWEKEQTNG